MGQRASRASGKKAIARQVAPSQRKATSNTTNARREQLMSDSVRIADVIGDIYTVMSIEKQPISYICRQNESNFA